MRALPLALMVVLTLMLTGCAAIGSIFKAGMFAGLIAIAILIVLIVLLVRLIL